MARHRKLPDQTASSAKESDQENSPPEDLDAGGMGGAAVQQIGLRKRDLIDRTAARSGVKKSDVKTAIDALLVVLGEHMIEGQEILVPPLGKLKVVREKQVRAGRQFVLKLIVPPTTETASEGLAEGDD